MIIVCPDCDSQYLVNAKAIGEGRTVKCASCGHTWYQEPIEDEVDQAIEAKKADIFDKTDESQTVLEDVDFTPAAAGIDEAESDDSSNISDNRSSEKPENIDDGASLEDDESPPEDNADESEEDDDIDNADEAEDKQDDVLDNEEFDIEESDDISDVKDDTSKDSDKETSASEDDDFSEDDMDDDDLDEVLGRLQGGEKKDIDPIPKGLGPISEDDIEEEKTPEKAAISAVGVVIVTLALFTGTVLAGILNKEALVMVWPPSAGFFEMVHLPVGVTGEGLVFSDLKASVKETASVDYLVIQGKIENNDKAAITIPAMKVQLNKNNMVLQDWVIPSENYVIGGGEAVPFEYGLPNPKDKNATSVTVTFATADDIAAATSGE